jgi:hypothetical protein
MTTASPRLASSPTEFGRASASLAPVPQEPEPEALSPEELADLQDAIDQDKELRWLERDATLAERALTQAPEGVTGAELKALHHAHVQAQDRLRAAHDAILAWLQPQFDRRRSARLRGADHVVFTREEFRLLSLAERDKLDQPGGDPVRVAAELKAKAREILQARGWKPRQAATGPVASIPGGLAHHWAMRDRLVAVFAPFVGA